MTSTLHGHDLTREDAGEAINAMVQAQVALAQRTDSAGVREWADNCRTWTESNRDELSRAIAKRE